MSRELLKDSRGHWFFASSLISPNREKQKWKRFQSQAGLLSQSYSHFYFSLPPLPLLPKDKWHEPKEEEKKWFCSTCCSKKYTNSTLCWKKILRSSSYSSFWLCFSWTNTLLPSLGPRGLVQSISRDLERVCEMFRFVQSWCSESPWPPLASFCQYPLHDTAFLLTEDPRSCLDRQMKTL